MSEMVNLYIKSIFRNGLIFVMLTGLLVTAEITKADTTCALIPTEGKGEKALVALDLLELRLGQVPGVILVDRANIDKVLNEQELSAALGAQGVNGRQRLGQLLHADILIFLGQTAHEEHVALEIAVAETKLGLRVYMDSILWDDAQPEKVIRSLVGSVKQAMEKIKEGFQAIYAVPPLVCKDLDLEFAHLSSAYAKLLERILLNHPSILVVELPEAKVLVNEFILTSEMRRIQRKLPFFIRGSYQNHGFGDERTVDIHLALEHGADRVGEISISRVASTNVAESITAPLLNLVQKFLQEKRSIIIDSDKEIEQLFSHAEVLRQLGYWDKAMPLYETLLLLKPFHYEAHSRLFEGCAWFVDKGLGSCDYSKRMEYGERALNYLPRVLEEKIDYSFCEVMAGFDARFYLPYMSDKKDPDRALRDKYRTLCERKARIIMSALEKNGRKFGPIALGTLAQSVKYAIKEYGPERTSEVMFRLLTILDESNVPLWVVLPTTYSRSDEHQRQLIGRLQGTSSQRLELLAAIYENVLDIKDQESYDVVIRRLSKIPGYANLGAQDRREVQKIATDRIRRIESHEKSGSKYDLQLPKLVELHPELRLKAQRHVSGPPKLVYDWLIADHAEFIATDHGLLQLNHDSTLALIDTNIVSRLYWDGENIWSVAENKIFVSGRDFSQVTQISPKELGFRICPEKLHFVTFEPGFVSLVGYDEKEGILRTWITNIHLEENERTGKRSRIETFFEANVQKTTSDNLALTFRPAWAYRSCFPEDAGQRIMFLHGGWRRKKPLRVDIANKHVEFLKIDHVNLHLVIQDRDTLYAIRSYYSHRREQSSIYRCVGYNRGASLWVTHGERPTDKWGSGGAFFRSGFIFENKLHLVTNPGHLFSWLAVDLDTGKTSVLSHRLPPLLNKWNISPRFCISQKYGLILLCEDKAYRVILPPENEWPELANSWGNESESAATTKAEKAN